MTHDTRTLIGTLRFLLISIPAAGCGATTVVLREPRPLTITARAPEPERIEVEDSRIRVDETIHFETGSAVIRPESYRVLDEVAQTINDRPDISLIRVEGHTDRQGTATYNRRLSQSRAEAVVDYLVRRGVSAERLEARGYGFDRPVASNDDEDGRSRNRRVEFNIVASTTGGPQASAGGGGQSSGSL